MGSRYFRMSMLDRIVSTSCARFLSLANWVSLLIFLDTSTFCGLYCKAAWKAATACITSVVVVVSNKENTSNLLQMKWKGLGKGLNWHHRIVPLPLTRILSWNSPENRSSHPIIILYQPCGKKIQSNWHVAIENTFLNGGAWRTLFKWRKIENTFSHWGFSVIVVSASASALLSLTRCRNAADRLLLNNNINSTWVLFKWMEEEC